MAFLAIIGSNFPMLALNPTLALKAQDALPSLTSSLSTPKSLPMLRSLHRNPLRRHIFPFSPTSHLHTTTQPTADDSSAFAASYLAASCGLSPAAAAATAKKLGGRLTSPSRPDAVLRLLRSHGFTQPQLARLVAKVPRLLLSDPDTTLKPKLDFVLGLGVGCKVLSASPGVLASSLERRLKPNFTSLVAALGSTDGAVSALTCAPRLLAWPPDVRLLPNMEILRRHGVQLPTIVRLSTMYTLVLVRRPDQFAAEIGRLIEMGFKPSSLMFGYALIAMAGSKAATWERKMAVYRGLGWSDAEALLAFKKFPFVMLISEEKIKKMAGFFTEELGWGKEVILRRPVLLSLSLEKRVIPRLSVWNVLASKGVVKGGLSASSVALGTKKFLEKYVNKYMEKYPEVLETYHGKIGAVGLKQKQTDS